LQTGLRAQGSESLSLSHAYLLILNHLLCLLLSGVLTVYLHPLIGTTLARSGTVTKGSPFQVGANVSFELFLPFLHPGSVVLREVHSYDQVISTGHPGSRFGAVESEVKPKSARATLDGQAISSGKSKIHLGLGPHLLAASAGDKQQEHRFVVLDQGPDKFELEIK
jgi:hypothetical protein